MDYSPGFPPIWLVTDGSMTEIAGVIFQGQTWNRGHIAAFFSTKLTSAQANYAVHKVEILTGIEAMMCYCDILLECEFTWVMDYKGLVHLLGQWNLSGQQARWLEKISEFNFKVEYVSGESNVLADALSCIYSNDQPGTIHASSEYTQHDDNKPFAVKIHSLRISTPILVGIKALAVQPSCSSAHITAVKELQPETAKEFAKRIKHVVLRVPEQQEGMSPADQPVETKTVKTAVDKPVETDVPMVETVETTVDIGDAN